MRLLLMIAMTMVATSCPAAIQAVYHVAGEKHQVVVEVDDVGRARLGVADDEDFYVIVDPTDVYVMTTTSDTDYGVARPADVLAAARITKFMLHDHERLPAMPPVEIAPGGARGRRTIAGIVGSVFMLRPVGARSSMGGKEVVVADDVALRPIGVALRRSIGALLTLLPLIDGMTANHMRAIEQVLSTFENGMPLAIGSEIVLSGLSQGDVVAPARLALPAKPSSVPELVKLIRERQAEK